MNESLLLSAAIMKEGRAVKSLENKQTNIFQRLLVEMIPPGFPLPPECKKHLYPQRWLLCWGNITGKKR